MSIVEYTNHTSVTSSLIKKVWYALPVRELYVEMSNGSIYGYKDVSPTAYENFLFANSKGAWYNKHIKGVYKSTGDTFGLEFRPAPGLSRKHTDAKSPWWASDSVLTGPVNTAPVAAPAERNYRVSGTILAPTTVSLVYKANSMEEAMQKFRDAHKDKQPEVTQVSKV